MELTLKQCLGLISVIDRARMTEFYESLLSYGTIHGAKLPSLEEFLGVTLGQDAESNFDEKTDKFLEQYALKKLQEGKEPRG